MRKGRVFEGLELGKRCVVGLICWWAIDVIALLDWLGVVVRFLLCMIILQKLAKRGKSWVDVGDAWYRGSVKRIWNAVSRGEIRLR